MVSTRLRDDGSPSALINGGRPSRPTDINAKNGASARDHQRKEETPGNGIKSTAEAASGPRISKPASPSQTLCSSGLTSRIMDSLNGIRHPARTLLNFCLQAGGSYLSHSTSHG